MWQSVVKGVYYCGLVIFVFCANKCLQLGQSCLSCRAFIFAIFIKLWTDY